MLITVIQTKKQAWGPVDHHLVVPFISVINYSGPSIMLNKNLYNPPIQMASADTCI